MEREHSLDGAVTLSIARFQPWISSSTLPFFPEYTDHGINHIENVLRTAAALIKEEAWEHVTPSDAAVLVLSILLHDCAMHVTEDGFLSLLQQPRSEKMVAGMGDTSWSALWEDFYAEASRFSGRKLKQLFGDNEPVRRPPAIPNSLTKRDRLLIGEFLRRHHPRLAHEIALYGVPTTGQSPLVLEGFAGATEHIPRLSGIVARSHGANVRSYLPFLQSEFHDTRQYRATHAVFLMTLLRVSDYLQIQADRAPTEALRVKSLASPVSQGEWKAHAAIKEVRQTHDDPEAIYVEAMPEDIDTFLRVQTWLNGIQQELDDSWAVLGEVYGRYKPLDQLGLVLRRVRSSLDDVDGFSRRVNYVPRRAFFRATGADLLKLLIEPLYGDKPEIGLRELIQNAVDAVRELHQYQKDVPGVSKVPLHDQAADVVVKLEERSKGDACVTVTDRGIGMTPEVIVNYFLSAGASFRRSEDWRKMFEAAPGQSKVLRAGRFGVGALASFLLGSEIEVTTRHVQEAEGIHFKASVDSDSVELRKVKCPVGTSIVVHISPEVAAALSKPPGEWDRWNLGDSWDWYFLAYPSLQRVLRGQSLRSKCTLPAPDKPLPPDWRNTSDSQFGPIHWTYHEPWHSGYWARHSALICNGIFVQHAMSNWDEKYGLYRPHLSVFDPDGHLPLNLQRTGLTSETLPFEDCLITDIMKDFAAYALLNGPAQPPTSFLLGKSPSCVAYPGSARIPGYAHEARDVSHDWYFTKEAFGYLAPSIFQDLKYHSALVARIDGGDPGKIPFQPPAHQPTVFLKPDGRLTTLDGFVRTAVQIGCKQEPASVPHYYYHSPLSSFKDYQLKGVRFLISGLGLRRATASKGKVLGAALRKALKQEWTSGDWHLVKVGTCPEQNFDFKDLVSSSGRLLGELSLILELYFDWSKPAPVYKPATEWVQILKQPEIPFNPNLRRERLKHAYEALAEYLRAHEQSSRKTAPR